MSQWNTKYFDLFNETERTWLARIEHAFGRVKESEKPQAWQLVKATAQRIASYQRRVNQAHRSEIIQLEIALMSLWSETLYSHPGIQTGTGKTAT